MAKVGETVPDDDSVVETAPPRVPDALGRGAALGRYIVLEQLGEGGMGVVYAAYDPELDRKLAVKLLRANVGPSGMESRRMRLLREAQALARLDHPNVVAVHDVGTHDGHIFVAMDLISGTTVRAWLDEQPRDWRAIVDVYRQAGRGLAAAHELGIVHRDFKPDNVLIDANGRVRVVDFGLARSASDSDDPPRAADATAWERSPGALASPLTRPGALMGTPGYIAPEQVAGVTVPAIDQFSLCVALWDALYRELPFAGESVTELAEAAARGNVREPPKQTRVPTYIHRALLRGLRPQPADRFPSINELLDALDQDPASRWQRLASIAAIGAAVIAIAAFVVLRSRSPETQVCRAADQPLAGVWDGERRLALQRSFVATKAAYAPRAAEGVAAILDGYASSWTAMRVDACEATRVRGEQSEELLDLRMACLDERLRELRALTDVFANADAKAVEKSVQAAQSLAPIAGCADTAALKDPQRVAPVAIRARVDELRAKLPAIRALDNAGRFAPALAQAAPLVDEIRALKYRPLEAAALVLLGTIQKDAGDGNAAQATLEAAALAATAARDDLAAAEAATLLVRVAGYDRMKRAEGQQWAERAQASLEAHPDDRIRSLLENNIGILRFAENRNDEALTHYQASLALRERIYGPDSPITAASLDNIGLVYDAKGDNIKGAEFHQKALAIDEAALGPMHPTVALTLTNLGVCLSDQGKYDEAMPIVKRAIAIKEAAYGAESAQLSTSLNQLGNLLYFQAHYPECEAVFRRSLAIKLKTVGPEHPLVAGALGNLANCVERQQRYDEAEALDRQSLAIKEKALGPEHSDVGHGHTALGEIALERGKFADALDHYQRALAIWQKTSPDSPVIAAALHGIGESQARLGHTVEAIAAFEKALAIRDAKPVSITDRGETRASLAKVLWEHGERDRAKRLSTEAAKIFADAGARAELQRKDLAAWQSAHGL